MVMYRKILLPTDGSEGAEVAVEHASEIAEKFDAEVEVLYVVDVRVSTPGEYLSTLKGQLRDEGETATSDIVEEMEIRGIEASSKVVNGIPHKEINRHVDENDIDLVLMGTHGRTGLDRMLVGSTAEKVVRTCDAPVMTVRREG